MKTMLAVIPPGEIPAGYFQDSLARAKDAGAKVSALYVVDAAWFRLSAADWLSTGPSRAGFDSYMRETLAVEGKKAGETLMRMGFQAGVTCAFETVEAEPEAALSAAVDRLKPCEVTAVAGHPGLEGYRPGEGVNMRWYHP